MKKDKEGGQSVKESVGEDEKLRVAIKGVSIIARATFSPEEKEAKKSSMDLMERILIDENIAKKRKWSDLIKIYEQYKSNPTGLRKELNVDINGVTDEDVLMALQ